MSKVHPIHKNPAWFAVIPLWAWATAGTATVATTAIVVNNSKLDSINEQIRNVQAIEDDLYADLASLRQGIQVDTSKSTTMVLAPSSEKVALLQEATAYRDAANHLIKKGGTVQEAGELLSWFSEALDQARTAPDDETIAQSSTKLSAPLQRAGTRIATYGSDMTRIVADTITNQDQVLIGEVQKDIAERQPSKMLGDAIKQTGEEIAVPFQVLAGVVTGKKPMGMSVTKWNIIKYSIYGAVGLGVIGYAASKIAAVGELVDGD